MHSTGFGCLDNCESVLAFEEQLNGDAKVRLSFSEAHRGGTHREETITVEDGRECFFHLRSQLQAELRKSGNIHWGDISDVKALSDTLDVGIFIFCERLQNKSQNCLTYTGINRSFPYWISIYYEEGRHFRLAELSAVRESPSERFTCFWTAETLPPVLYREYEGCNRAM